MLPFVHLVSHDQQIFPASCTRVRQSCATWTRGAVNVLKSAHPLLTFVCEDSFTTTEMCNGKQRGYFVLNFIGTIDQRIVLLSLFRLR